jgi:hypothetical protein
MKVGEISFTREQIKVLLADLSKYNSVYSITRTLDRKAKKRARVKRAERIVAAFDKELRSKHNAIERKHNELYQKAKRTIYFGTLKDFDKAFAALKRFHKSPCSKPSEHGPRFTPAGTH